MAAVILFQCLDRSYSFGEEFPWCNHTESRSFTYLPAKFSDWFSLIHIPSGFLAALVNFTNFGFVWSFLQRDSPQLEKQNILNGAEDRGIKWRREKIVWFLFHAKYYSGRQIKINAKGGAWYAFSWEDKCIDFLYWKA